MDGPMFTTPGFTEPNLSEMPLASEGEMTLGPPEWNPYDDPEVPPEDYAFFEGRDVQPAEPMAASLPLFEPPKVPRF